MPKSTLSAPAVRKPTVSALDKRLALIERRLSEPSAPVLDSLLTEEQLAERLGHRDRDGNVSTRKLEDWRAKGHGPAYIRPVGTRSPYYRPEVVDAWLLANEHASTSEEVR